MNKRLENLKLSIRKTIYDTVRIDDEPLFEREIGQMVSGELGWTVPWALQDGKLSEDYPIDENPQGTVRLRVFCVEPHKYETHLIPDSDVNYSRYPREAIKIVITSETCAGCGASAWIKLSRTEMQCAYCGRVICP